MEVEKRRREQHKEERREGASKEKYSAFLQVIQRRSDASIGVVTDTHET